MKPIAALFVESRGVYFGLPGVDCWDVDRDAKKYRGTDPVVAHPPCARWGAYWPGAPYQGALFALGDDDGCFASALFSIRTWGGVLEHPAKSHAWRWFGLPEPRLLANWTEADSFGGRAIEVNQGDYGHRAQKPTWLYAIGSFPDFPSAVHTDALRPCINLSRKQRRETPAPFAAKLVELARSVGTIEAERRAPKTSSQLHLFGA